jgi:iron complex outermembrane receptor protein
MGRTTARDRNWPGSDSDHSLGRRIGHATGRARIAQALLPGLIAVAPFTAAMGQGAASDAAPAKTVAPQQAAPAATLAEDAAPSVSAQGAPAATQAQDAPPPASAQSAPAATPAQDAPPPSAAPQSTAPGQPAEAGSKLEEVVVTATRHSELLSKVPISISAFTKEKLDAIGAKDITDVVRFTPGMMIDAQGTNSISIRGISSNAGAGTTGIYIDDTPIQMRVNGFNSDDALPKAFDLERIEILRGPQGTLFGAGAEGGAVRYIMAQPNMNKSDLYARSEVAFTKNGNPSYEAGVAGGAPLVDNVLGFRVSAWYRRDGGWIDRVDPFNSNVVVDHNANYQDTYALRLAAKWAASDAVNVIPSMMYQDRDQHGVTLYYPFLSDPGSTSFRNAEPDLRPISDRYFLPALKVEAGIGDLSLISNTSYYTRRDVSGYSGTNYNLGYFQTFNDPTNNTTGNLTPMLPPPPGCNQASQYPLIDGTGIHLCPGIRQYRANAPVTNQQQSFTEEIRLQTDNPNARLIWTTGIYFSKTNQTSTEEIIDPMLDTLLQAVFGVTSPAIFGSDLLPNGDSYYAQNSSRDRQIAAYGEATYAITPKIKATAGLRVSHFSLDFNHFGNGPQNFGPAGGSGNDSENPITPKASLSFEPDGNNLFYATYARGFREGGANGPIPVVACATDLAALGLTQAPLSYKSDAVNSYELGSKNKIGQDFRIAASVYYISWQGIQQNVYMQGCGFQFTSNLGSAASKGGDIQIEYVPTSSLSFDLAVGRTEAHYTSTSGTAAHLIAPAGDAVEGQAYGPAPPWTVALGAQYDFSALDRKSFVRLDYQYWGHSDKLSPTEDPRTATFVGAFTTPSYSYVTARAGTTFGSWTVSAFVDNLFNTHPQILDSSDAFSVLDQFNPNPPSQLITSYTLRPRTAGLTAIYHM